MESISFETGRNVVGCQESKETKAIVDCCINDGFPLTDRLGHHSESIVDGQVCGPINESTSMNKHHDRGRVYSCGRNSDVDCQTIKSIIRVWRVQMAEWFDVPSIVGREKLKRNILHPPRSMTDG